MKLLQLKLNHFKGIKDFTLDADGQSVNIFADNRVGKTTLFDALTWLLFDKDSHGRSTNAFSIKTRENGKVIHDIDHEVEGVFDTITLRKVYREKWTRKRGSAQKVHDGHTTSYFVDGDPVKMSDYQDRVADIMSEEMFRILTNPTYFPEEMHWSERRNVLLDLCGDFTDADIIADIPALQRYPEILGGKDQARRESALKTERKKLLEQLDYIPSRIDENQRSIEEVEGLEEAKAKVSELKENKQTIEARRSEVKSGGAVAELKVKLTELDSELIKARNDHQQQVEESLKDARAKVSDLQDRVDEAEADLRQAKRQYAIVHDDYKQTLNEVEQIKHDIETEQSRKPDPKPEEDEGPKICALCEQPLPEQDEADHEDHYEKYLKDFNSKKAARIKELKEKLEITRSKVNELEEALKEKEQVGAKARSKDSQRKEALKKAKAALQEQKTSQPTVDSTKAYKQLVSRQEELQAKIANHEQEKQDQLSKLNEHISDLDKQIYQAEQVIHIAEQNDKTRQRIKELQEEQKRYAGQLEQVEEDLYVIEQFVQAESQYITSRVNDLFNVVNWKLFEEQLNGGTKPCCEAMVGSIPYTAGLNTGSRIQAGIDIINTLSDYYDLSAPVVIDNAESVTSLPDTDLQVIRLIVSRPDKQLRVEPAEEHELAIH